MHHRYFDLVRIGMQLRYYVPAPPDAQGPNVDPDNPQRLQLLKGIDGYAYPAGLQVRCQYGLRKSADQWS